jgi:hypothetical protein
MHAMQTAAVTMQPSATVSPTPPERLVAHSLIMYEFMVCCAVSVALGLLVTWHARLISRAETSIEVHTNKKERGRMHNNGLVMILYM